MKTVKIIFILISTISFLIPPAYSADEKIEEKIKILENRKTELEQKIRQKEENISKLETEVSKIIEPPKKNSKYSTINYKIKRGDTLWALAGKYLGNSWNYMIIVRYNQDKIKNPDLIIAGDTIIMPVRKLAGKRTK